MDEKITRIIAVTKKTGNQFLDGDFKSHKARLSEKDYGRAMDSIVIACVDVIVVYKGKVIIGERIADPWPSYWIIGGRMFPGETFEKSARRKIKGDLGLDINPSRFSYVDTYNFVWSERQQEPKNRGLHCISIVMMLEINEKEFKKIKFNKAEYSAIEFWWPEEINQAKYMHPAIKKMAEEVVEFLLQKSMKEELNF